MASGAEAPLGPGRPREARPLHRTGAHGCLCAQGGPSTAAAEWGADPSGRDVTATGPRPSPALSPAAGAREGRSGRAAPAGLQSSRPPSARGRKVPFPWWRAAPASGDPVLSSFTPRNVTTKLLRFREPSSVKSWWVWPRYLCHRSTRKARPSSDPAWLYSGDRSLYPARTYTCTARGHKVAKGISARKSKVSGMQTEGLR